MDKYPVSIVRYETPYESVRNAVNLCNGLENVGPAARVFIKPNIVFWTKEVPFPKWGVITTTRVVEDIIVLLKERGVTDIVVGEGTVTMNPKDQYMGRLNLTRPRYMVKSQLKIFTPVGIPITMVAIPKTILTYGLAPMVKK